ncbi:Integrin beta-2 [Thelohanellus kitauei]|uniref:Integrin beta n=1 Tax=Thelohanellus kitauei TaxID=669202 RepID=A0A0C2MQ93_THEKT|nr:Integrin beta-2 [Thelohanellus kitauei]
MTGNMELVKKHLEARDSLGLDQPESVLDAIAQVTHCLRYVGMDVVSNEAARLIIIITDSSSKRAGHGDIIGLFRPSDGYCKIGQSENVAMTDTDYFHPHFLGNRLSDNNIRVLFLTHKSKIKHYEVLTESFKHQVVGILDYVSVDSKKLKEIIDDAVEQKRRIQFNMDQLKSHFDVDTDLECPTPKTSDSHPLECSNVEPGGKVKITIKMRHSTSSNPPESISSHVEINRSIKVGVDVQIPRECSCTKKDTKPDNPDPYCNNKGYKVCGKCVDVPEWTNQTPYDINKVECNSDQECGEYGKCICGTCHCKNSPERFYGRGCSCTDIICPFTKKGQCICFCNIWQRSRHV